MYDNLTQIAPEPPAQADRANTLRLLRPAEIAAQLGVSVRTVYNLIGSGRLHACRIGLGAGSIRIHPDDLAAYIARLRSASARPPAPRPA